MRFEEVLPAFREGKMIRRDVWPDDRALYRHKGEIYRREWETVLLEFVGIRLGESINMELSEILADDWRVL